MPILDDLDQLQAVHFRHVDVRNHHIDVLAIQNLQGFIGAVGRQARIADVLNAFLEYIPDVRIIVHNQDARGFPRRIPIHAAPRRLLVFGFRHPYCPTA